MAGDDLNVWYDPEGDYLEIVFDQKAGTFEETSLENVMRKRDAEGNLLAISISNLSSFARTRPPRESISVTYGVWAVFNLDVADGKAFHFDVALGHEPLPDPEGYAPADACATCSVFFDAAGKHRERRLKIMHKEPVPRPALLGEDPLSPVTLTSLCRDQLALALRLFQPQSFSMVPLGRRREVREAYRSMKFRQGEAPPPYVLRDSQVTTFRAFAGRLLEFHAWRNRYRFNRSDFWRLIAPPGGDSVFLDPIARLMIATDLFERANEDHAPAGELRLLWLVMAAEALFADDDKTELSSRLATRMAVLNGADVDDVNRYRDLVRSMYDARSNLVHGAPYVPHPAGRLRTLVGDAGFIEIPPDRLLAFNNLVRASILYFIALVRPGRAPAPEDAKHKDVLAILYRSPVDSLEIADLRRRANEYWGFPGREDEMLCSGLSRE